MSRKYRILETYSDNILHKLADVVSLPLIFSVFIPIVIADVWVEVYHRIGFWLYGLDYIPRNRYIRIDRHKLSKLNWIEKIGCIYCGYANGWFAYAQQIAATTEGYWCAIKHETKSPYQLPQHQQQFKDRQQFE